MGGGGAGSQGTKLKQAQPVHLRPCVVYRPLFMFNRPSSLL